MATLSDEKPEMRHLALAVQPASSGPGFPLSPEYLDPKPYGFSLQQEASLVPLYALLSAAVARFLISKRMSHGITIPSHHLCVGFSLTW